MNKIKVVFLQSIGKLMQKFGKGSSIVGYLDTKFKFNVLNKVDINDKEVIFVVGTNGKTTIANTLNNIYKKKGLNVLSNLEGANLVGGIKNTLIMDIKDNKIKSDVLLLEVDEKSLKHVVKIVKPKHVIITNFFRDQLDRYFEISLIIEEIVATLMDCKPNVYYNGQDALLYNYLKDTDLKQIKFKLNKNEDSLLEQKNIIEIKYCPNCKTPLDYEYYHYSHIGEFSCKTCDYLVDNISYEFDKIDGELYYKENKIISVKDLPLYLMINYCLISTFCLENNISLKEINSGIKSVRKIGGRNNNIVLNDKEIYLNLAKNVVGMEQTIEFLKGDNINLLIAFNDNYADGKDVSWIWDVDFESLIDNLDSLYIVGIRKEDMALRFLYSGLDINKLKMFETIKEAMDELVLCNNPKVITNYTPLSEINSYFNNKGAL